MKVLSDKQQQLMMKIQENRKAQQETRKRREELIHELKGGRSLTPEKEEQNTVSD